MKFQANKQDLSQAVSSVIRACAVKSQIKALEGVLVRLEGNLLSVTGYNLELGIVAKINVQGVQDGAAVVDGKLLSAILKKLDSTNAVEIALDGDTLRISSGRTKLKTQALPEVDYPALPKQGDGGEITLTGEMFKRLVTQTIYAVALTDIKPVHTGCKFTLKENKLTVDSTDGMRLVRAKENVSGHDVSVVIPAKSLQEAIKIISSDDENITISITNSFATIEKPNLKIVSRVLGGDFIDVDKTINLTVKDTIIVEKSLLLSALERVSVVVDTLTTSPLVLEIENGQVNVSVKNSLGEVSDTVEVEYNGQAVRMGVNAKYIKDAVSHAESDILQIGVVGALSPLVITEKGNDSYTALVLPVRLKG